MPQILFWVTIYLLALQYYVSEKNQDLNQSEIQSEQSISPTIYWDQRDCYRYLEDTLFICTVYAASSPFNNQD